MKFAGKSQCNKSWIAETKKTLKSGNKQAWAWNLQAVYEQLLWANEAQIHTWVEHQKHQHSVNNFNVSSVPFQKLICTSKFKVKGIVSTWFNKQKKSTKHANCFLLPRNVYT